MIPVQSLSLEEHGGKNREDNEGDDLLDDFQLHQSEGTAVIDESDAVGRYLTGVFEECDSPAEGYDANQRERGEPAELLFQFQMAVPRESHEDV